MAYSIAGLPVEPFKPFFGLPDEELAKHHIVRVTADAPVGYPCRVLLEDAKPGNTLLLVNHYFVRYLYGHEAVDRIVEGSPDVLIENGIVLKDRLQKELITVAELASAAHKQGFPSLAEIDRAILDPGGTICFFPKKTTSEALRHEEIVTRLDRISAQLAALRA